MNRQIETHQASRIIETTTTLELVDVELEKGYERYMDREYGFEAVEPRVEIYGYCKDCRASGKDKAYKEKMGL